ncbi:MULTISPECIES: NEL-type E3 ubiquitin ligase domain-containing protein [unclassified Burkholderia]|uniref:NEL-type E3 ubiquitin ligase domain-containing protein n=1 Tax=unclassified Burkholderia TaxID=2613784 RepID=UPI00158B6A2F|nr:MULTISPECIES: NEL-type E3 ubiquitin ligase domain-containing protein [unclassified Burkholderia]
MIGPIDELAGTVTGDVLGSIGNLIGIVRGDVNGDVDQLAGTVEGDVNGSVNRLDGTVRGDINGSVNRLDGTVGGDVNGSVNRLDGTVRGDINGSVDRLDGTVGGDVNGSVTQLGGIVRGDINGNVNWIDGAVGGDAIEGLHHPSGMSRGESIVGSIRQSDQSGASVLVGVPGLLGEQNLSSSLGRGERIAQSAVPDVSDTCGPDGRANRRDSNASRVDARPSAPHNALMLAVSRWTSGCDHVATQWSHFDDERNACNFATLLDRLDKTAEALNGGARTLLAQRICDVLDELGRSAELRSTCFAIAEDALGACADRVALGFEYVEDAIVNHKASRGDFSQQALLRLGKQKFRQAVVERIAREKCTPGSDPVEVHLAYRTQLKEPLDLPGKSIHMLHRFAARVSQKDLIQAIATVRRLEASEELREFLCKYEPWKEHLKRTHVDAFTRWLAPVVANMDKLSVPPADMSDGEYKKKCDELAELHKSLEDNVVRALTASCL